MFSSMILSTTWSLSELCKSHSQSKSGLQLNVYASLSRERMGLVWLIVLVCVRRSTKNLKLEFFLGLAWHNAFSNILVERVWWKYTFRSWCSDWEAQRYAHHSVWDVGIARANFLFYKRTGCKSIVIGVLDRHWCFSLEDIYFTYHTLRVLFTLKQSALVAYKLDWRFRYKNILLRGLDSIR